MPAAGSFLRALMGYTPAFDSIYTGTLYGKWPTAAVWASLLPLVDVRGEINLAPEAIAGMTGWPIELLLQGIKSLCEPDPRSRSKAEEGRRLVPIDPGRDWGWRVVNVSLYRAKAAGFNQIADGRNAEKVRRYKERHRQTPADTTGLHKTPETPHSDSDSDSDKEGNTKSSSQGGVGGDASRKRSAEQRGSRIPTPFLVTGDMRKWAAEKTPHVDLERATEEFCNYWRALPGQRGRKLDWAMTWQNRMRECEDKAVQATSRGPPRKTIDERLAALGEDS